MFDFPIFPELLPLGAILFDFLFILIAIPIEAYVLNRRLKFDKKSSTFYAICINLFSNAIGWAIFFLIEPILSPQLRAELMSYILFNRFSSPNIQTIIILVAFIIFFVTFLLKVVLLKTLLISLSEFKKTEVVTTPPRRSHRRSDRARVQTSSLFTTVLIANALSYSAISIILFMMPRNI